MVVRLLYFHSGNPFDEFTHYLQLRIHHVCTPHHSPARGNCCGSSPFRGKHTTRTKPAHCCSLRQPQPGAAIQKCDNVCTAHTRKTSRPAAPLNPAEPPPPPAILLYQHWLQQYFFNQQKIFIFLHDTHNIFLFFTRFRRIAVHLATRLHRTAHRSAPSGANGKTIWTACRVHFAPSHTREPRQEPFTHGRLPGGFACPAAIPVPTAAQPARVHRAPNRLDLRPRDLGGAL